MISFLLFSAGGFLLGTLAVVLFLLSLFLVFLIMIQRGKGGGIAGSLTGTAQSAFGARGGDMLMWWTIGFTGVWIVLSCVTIMLYSSPKQLADDNKGKGSFQEETNTSQVGGAETSTAAEALTKPDTAADVDTTNDDIPDEAGDSSDSSDDSESPEAEDSTETTEADDSTEPSTDEPSADDASTDETDTTTPDDADEE
ncbi:MAG: preprotein translocase subunit SecG [Planctomycetaceae bacterium]|nr:preprotein translocase subunit SecG [Planctomycetaceae bacterium]